MRRLLEKRRDILIGIGIFLILIGVLPFLGVQYQHPMRTIVDVVLAACGIAILILR